MLHKIHRTLNLLALGAFALAFSGCASAARSDLQHHQAASFNFNLPEPLMLTLQREKVFIYGGYATQAKRPTRAQATQYLGVYGNAGDAQGPLRVTGVATLELIEPAAEADDGAAVVVVLADGKRHTLYDAYFVACGVEPVGLADAKASDCARISNLQAKAAAPSLHVGWMRSPLVEGGTHHKWLPVARLWTKERARATITTGAAVTAEEARLSERFAAGQDREAAERSKREAALKQQRRSDLMAELSKPPLGTQAVCVQVGRSGSDAALLDDAELRCDAVGRAMLGDLKQAGWAMTKSDRTSFSDNTVSWKVELKKTSVGEPGK